MYSIEFYEKGNSMKTWDDYKAYVRSTGESGNELIDEVECMASVIGAIIEKRTAMGISQRQLALMCGMPQSSVARIESMRTTPKLDTLLNITRNLGLKLTLTDNPAPYK